MESQSKTARPYSIAAFRQAQKEGRTDEWSRMLALLAAVASDRTMLGLLANPKVERSRLADLIIDVCGDELSDTGRNFVRILVQNRRVHLMRDIAAAYEAERARSERRRDVVVTTAYELSAVEQNTINVALTKRLGTKVDLSMQVDPGLIGGIVVRFGDTVIDASIRGRLGQLARAVA